MEITISEINELLYRLGVTANYTGFFHTSYAIKLCVERQDRLVQVTKMVYPEVAKEYNTNWKAVERNIRTACQRAWRVNRKHLSDLAGYPLYAPPAASDFISIIAAHLQRSRKTLSV